MRIAVAQFRPIVGDVAANVAKIAAYAQDARAAGADIVVTPECALTGAAAGDLYLRSALYEDVRRGLDQLLEINGITLCIAHPVAVGDVRFNAVSVFRDGHILAQTHQLNIADDNVRYFAPAAVPQVFDVVGVCCAVLIGDDCLTPEPMAEAVEQGAELVFGMNAAAFERNIWAAREQCVRWRVEENAVPVVWVNAVGGQDERVFDGASFALNAAGERVFQAPAFAEGLYILNGEPQALNGDIAELPDAVPAMYQALVTAIRDYVTHNGFGGVLLGLSGGIDSALVLALAVDALGAERVRAVMMPSRYTAEISVSDSREMVGRLGVRYDEIDIWPLFEAFSAALSPLFAGLPPDTTEENLQARIRGTLLMALSNKTGAVVLTTGNKSEMATGYCTLYGDMAGGFAVLKDVPKTWVYALSRWRNTQGAVIPERIIERAPSAELRPDQTDQDSLPPYDRLDAMVDGYMEAGLSIEELVATGLPREEVERVVCLLVRNEYKRQQAPLGAKMTARAFGVDWRMPLTHRFL